MQNQIRQIQFQALKRNIQMKLSEMEWKMQNAKWDMGNLMNNNEG